VIVDHVVKFMVKVGLSNSNASGHNLQQRISQLVSTLSAYCYGAVGYPNSPRYVKTIVVGHSRAYLLTPGCRRYVHAHQR